MGKKKRIVYLILVAFLALMVIMTLVSRVMNESHVPEVETVSPASGNLKLSALGRGVVESGQLLDARLPEGVFTKDTLYVRGYFYDKEYVNGISSGDEVWLSAGGENPAQGILAAKMYDYKEDVIEAVIFPQEGVYAVGQEVEFVRKEVRVRCNCHIPNEVIYQDENGEPYIYILKSREGIAGNVTVAVKTPIHILMQNEARSAIAEELEMSTKIIKKGEGLEDGIRVREREW